MIVDFYRHFSDVELRVSQEVFNGVRDALADGRAEMAIGATQAIRRGRYAFRDMGMLSWKCVVASDHPFGSDGRSAERRYAAQLAVSGAGGYVAFIAQAYHLASG